MLNQSYLCLSFMSLFNERSLSAHMIRCKFSRATKSKKPASYNKAGFRINCLSTEDLPLSFICGWANKWSAVCKLVKGYTRLKQYMNPLRNVLNRRGNLHIGSCRRIRYKASRSNLHMPMLFPRRSNPCYLACFRYPSDRFRRSNGSSPQDNQPSRS